MNYFDSSVAIAVITYYPKWYRGKLRSIKHTDKVRGDLALEFFRKAGELHFPLVVADGKSAKTFRNKLSKLDHITLIKRGSLKRSVAKREVIKKASLIQGVKAIIITEPEKVSLLESIEEIAKPVLMSKADVVVPARNPGIFRKSYPSYMYASETEGNMLFNEILKTNGILKSSQNIDIFFGPCCLANSPKIVSLFTRPYHIRIAKSAYLDSYYYADPISIPIYFAIVMAHRKKLRVATIEILFSYSKSQKENELVGDRKFFEEKRKYQRLAVLTELLYFLNYLKRNYN